MSKTKVSQVICNYPLTREKYVYTLKRSVELTRSGVEMHTVELHASPENPVKSLSNKAFASVEDHGNGYSVSLEDGSEFNLNYHEAEELLILLSLQNRLNSKTKFKWKK